LIIIKIAHLFVNKLFKYSYILIVLTFDVIFQFPLLTLLASQLFNTNTLFVLTVRISNHDAQSKQKISTLFILFYQLGRRRAIIFCPLLLSYYQDGLVSFPGKYVKG
jgi:hypothetical protein